MAKSKPGVWSRLRDTLLGVSAYQPDNLPGNIDLDDPAVKAAREAMGGNIQPLPTTRLRWYLEDLERAQNAADTGYLTEAARLHRAMRRDGVITGLLGSRTKGLTRLAKRFYGDAEISETLRAKNGSRSVFDEMFPPSELDLLVWDGIDLGIGVAELVPVPGRNYPVMVRLEPEFLQYRWAENRWYYLSIAGAIPIVPGDGRWILHVPGGRLTPWMHGIWPALGYSWINKEHAKEYRSNYAAKLANPARVAYAPAGASEAQRIGFFKKILAWGVNTVLEMPPGWEAKILESNGRGWEVFQRQIDTSDNEFTIAIAGQVVTTTGGTGFSNIEEPASIRRDLIQADGDALAYTINTQGLPPFIAANWGEGALMTRATVVDWDTGTPADREKESRMLGQAANSLKLLGEALAPHGKGVSAEEFATRFAIPLTDEPLETPAPEEERAPGPAAKAVEGARKGPRAA